MLTLEVCTDAETANHHGGIAAILFFAWDVLFYLLLARARNLLDAVVGEGESSYDGRGVCIERKTIILAKQLVALQECIVGEELVQIVIATTERYLRAKVTMRNTFARLFALFMAKRKLFAEFFVSLPRK